MSEKLHGILCEVLMLLVSAAMLSFSESLRENIGTIVFA